MRFARNGLAALVVFGVIGCSGDITGSGRVADAIPVTQGEPLVDTAPYSEWASVVGRIEARQREYEKATRDAIAAGVVGGAVQGALVGALIQGEAGAFAGGVFGGFVGGEVARIVSSRLVLEHKNYMVRRESLDAVRTALREDIRNVEFDLILAREFVRSASEVASSELRPPQWNERVIGAQNALSDFYQVAIQRLLGAREVVAADADGELSDEFGSDVSRLASLVSSFGAELEKRVDEGAL